jgi:hypothetical protein
LVTLYHLAGRCYGFLVGIKFHLSAEHRPKPRIGEQKSAVKG